MFKKDPSLRSHEVVDGMDKGGPRAHLRNVGLLKEELKKPFIAIVNTYNEMHPGHFHLNELVGHIRDGVYAAGGVPFAFATGYGESGVDPAHRGVPVLIKPYTGQDVARALEQLLA